MGAVANSATTWGGWEEGLGGLGTQSPSAHNLGNKKLICPKVFKMLRTTWSHMSGNSFATR